MEAKFYVVLPLNPHSMGKTASYFALLDTIKRTAASVKPVGEICYGAAPLKCVGRIFFTPIFDYGQLTTKFYVD